MFKVVESWPVCREFQPTATEDSPCKGGRCMLNLSRLKVLPLWTATDVVQSGRPIFDDFFQHLWPYIGNNTANVVFQMVKRLWLIRLDFT
ncbi:hypothetical protein TNCV_1509961 [Trichonephila clavipes]|nr:hypothetical protein TNCV_1509961 [Trichonephila clavipes]